MDASPWITFLALILPVLSALVTLVITQRHSRSMAQLEWDRRDTVAREDRVFQAREARYSDRRDAVAGLLSASADETDRISQHEMHLGRAPGEIHDDYSFQEVNAALARLSIVASRDVASRGVALRDAVVDCFNGKVDRWQRYEQTQSDFMEAARAMLAGDAP